MGRDINKVSVLVSVVGFRLFFYRYSLKREPKGNKFVVWGNRIIRINKYGGTHNDYNPN